MYRERLSNFRGLLLTPDTASALDSLTQRLDKAGWTVELKPLDVGPWQPLSMTHAGREVDIQISRPNVSPADALCALWGYAVPMFFTPWNRYPVLHGDVTRFHFLGPWQSLYESLISQGRGHLAWPSVCAAAQVDVGRWHGDKADTRFLQAQLHRIGFPCGPVDGVIGPETQAALVDAGLGNVSFAQALAHLQEAKRITFPQGTSQTGHLALPGRELSLVATGGVKASRTALGASLAVDGPGQLIVTVGGSHGG